MVKNYYIGNGTYQRAEHTIPAHSVYTVDFNGSHPNYYRLNNMSKTPLYCTTNSYPRVDLYDFKAPAEGVGNFNEPTVRDKIYILNPSSEDAKIILVTWEGEFDPTYMAISEIKIDGSGELKTEGIVKSFETSLPAGNNKIGKVEIESTEMTLIRGDIHNVESSLDDNHEDLINKMTLIRGDIHNVESSLSNALTDQTGSYDKSLYELLYDIVQKSDIHTGQLSNIIENIGGSNSGDNLSRKIIAIPLGGSIYDYTFDLETQYPGYALEKFITVCGSTQGDTVNQVFYYIDSFDIKNQKPAQQCLPITTFNDIAENKGKTRLNIQCDELSKNDYAVFQVVERAYDVVTLKVGDEVQSGDEVISYEYFGSDSSTIMPMNTIYVWGDGFSMSMDSLPYVNNNTFNILSMYRNNSENESTDIEYITVKRYK